MISLDVEVYDWDDGESVYMTLPCRIEQIVNTHHSLSVDTGCSGIHTKNQDDLITLNDSLELINTFNPYMTTKLLGKMIDTIGGGSIDDEEFTRKISEDDYVLERIPSIERLAAYEGIEKCAAYLSTELFIPFAKNITSEELESIRIDKMDRVNWKRVWDYYYIMGYREIDCDGFIYVLNWENISA